MQITATIQEAQGRLKELIDMAGNGDEIILTRGDEPYVRLVAAVPKQPLKNGKFKSKPSWVS